MNFDQIVERACQEPTLVDALVFAAIWENERAIKQAVECEKSKISTASHLDAKFDTCFGLLFKSIIKTWNHFEKSKLP